MLAWVAKLLPLTHALAVMRYGLLGDSTGLPDEGGGPVGGPSAASDGKPSGLRLWL